MENNVEGRIEKWYENKVYFSVLIGSPLIALVVYFGNINTHLALIDQNIANINTNHEAHLQDLTQQIKDLNLTEVNEQGQIIDLQKQMLLVMNKLSIVK